MIPTNIYHCCVHKTGSQWIKKIFSENFIFKKTDMETYTYQKYLTPKGDPRKITERIFSDPFPPGTIVTPLYIDYNSYCQIKKPEHFRTFFVFRDPRDIVVSWYFSVKHTHPLMGKIPEHRKTLQSLPLEDGLSYAVQYLYDFGLFDALRSWFYAVPSEPKILFIRFENLIDPIKQHSLLQKLFTYCGIDLSPSEITKVMKKFSFNLLKKKRKLIQTTRFSHYRKGKAGDWKNYFTPSLLTQFNELTGDLPDIMGYSQ